MKKIAIALLVCIIFVAACDGGVTGDSGVTGNVMGNGKIKIGVLTPLTGDAASWGVGSKNGVPMAVAELREEGYDVELVIEDTTCDAVTGVTAARKLIYQDKVDMIVGGICSAVTLAVAPIAEQEHILMISPASTSPDITNAGDYIFRVVTSGSLAGQVGADYVLKEGVRNVALLAVNNDGALGNMKPFERSFAEKGNILMKVLYDEDVTSLATDLTRIAAAEPEMIVAVPYPRDMILLLQDKRRLGIEVPLFIAAETPSDASVRREAGDLLEGVEYIEPATAENEVRARFDAMYLEKYGGEPAQFSWEAYDAVMLYVETLDTVSGDRSEVKDALYDVKNWEGASGTITFDENGDVLKPYSIKKFIDGEAVEIAVIQP